MTDAVQAKGAVALSTLEERGIQFDVDRATNLLVLSSIHHRDHHRHHH